MAARPNLAFALVSTVAPITDESVCPDGKE